MTTFKLGRTVATPGALETLEAQSVTPGELLSRHAGGDWGDICDEDRGLNEAALRYGDRLMSVYQVGDDTVWVITEADRSATTILLPTEY